MTACPIATRLGDIESRIRAACVAAGRERDSVRLLAASKQQPADRITAALRAGQTLFGENRAQSLRDKFDEFATRPETLPRPEWHFIGHLQKNKVRLVIGRATLIHTLDSLSLAQNIAGRLTRQAEGAGTDVDPVSVLIEVKPESVVEDDIQIRVVLGKSSVKALAALRSVPEEPDALEARRADEQRGVASQLCGHLEHQIVTRV